MRRYVDTDFSGDIFAILYKIETTKNTLDYCSASEVCHPSEVRHLRFMAILKSFYCPVMAYMYALLLKEAIPFI